MFFPMIAALAAFAGGEGIVVVHDLILDSKILAGNPLKDSTLRHVAVFRPAGTEGKKLPVVLYLPGFGGSSVDALAHPEMWSGIVSDLAAKGVPVVFAVADGTNHFVCSQYVNSPGSGRYLDYLCDEVLPLVQRKEHCGFSLRDRLVVGHSSGGFGALHLGMARQRLFGGVVALSPDSYFDVTHAPFTRDEVVAKVPLEQIKAIEPPTLGPYQQLGGDVGYVLALCADYAGNSDGTFSWMYDEQGRYRDDVYQRWRDQDPAVMAERLAVPFAPSQRVYLDGAAQDDFKANIGAVKVAEEIGKKGVTFTAYYPPGHHSDHLRERIVRGVSWVRGVPVEEIKG
jgi:S-formylglutathione hydrolase FrmB